MAGQETAEYADLLSFRIIKVEVLLKRKLTALFRAEGYDISFEQWTILNVLYASPGLIQSELAERTYKDKANVTRILDVLSRCGLIRRERDDVDRRSFRISLSPEGKDMMDRLVPCSKAFNDSLQRDLAREDLETFYSVLADIAERLSS